MGNYDYTRVSIGDRIRDNQTMQDGRIVDVQMMGQWAVVITAIMFSDSAKREFVGLVNGAPAGTKIADMLQFGKTSLPKGQTVDVNLSQAANGTSATVTHVPGRATSPSDAASGASKTKLQPGLDRLRSKLETAPAGAPIMVDGRPVEKSKLLAVIEAMESDKDAFKRVMDPHSLSLTKVRGDWKSLVTRVRGQLTNLRGIDEEDIELALKYMAGNQREIWSWTEIAIKNSTVGSPMGVDAAQAEARFSTIKSSMEKAPSIAGVRPTIRNAFEVYNLDRPISEQALLAVPAGKDREMFKFANYLYLYDDFALAATSGLRHPNKKTKGGKAWNTLYDEVEKRASGIMNQRLVGIPKEGRSPYVFQTALDSAIRENSKYADLFKVVQNEIVELRKHPLVVPSGAGNEIKYTRGGRFTKGVGLPRALHYGENAYDAAEYFRGYFAQGHNPQNYLDYLDSSIQHYRSTGSAMRKSGRLLGRANTIWESVYRGGEGARNSIAEGLSLATDMGFIPQSKAVVLYAQLEEAYSRGTQGASIFHKVRPEIQKIIRSINDPGKEAPRWAAKHSSRLNALYTVRGAARQVMRELEGIDQLYVSDFSDVGADTRALSISAESAERSISASVAEGKTIQRINTLGKNREFNTVASKARQLQESLAYGNSVHLPVGKKLFRITGVEMNENGKYYAEGVFSPTRLHSAEGWKLVTNLKTESGGMVESLRTAITDLIADSVLDPRSLSPTGVSAALQDKIDEAISNRGSKLSLGRSGQVYESMEDLLRAVYPEKSGKSIFSQFHSHITRLAQSNAEFRPNTNMQSGHIKYGEGVFSLTDDVIHDVVVAYRNGISKATGKTAKEMHEKTLKEALTKGLEVSRIRGSSPYNVDSIDQIADTVASGGRLGNPMAELEAKETMVDYMQRAVLRNNLDLGNLNMGLIMDGGVSVSDVPGLSLIRRLQERGVLPRKLSELHKWLDREIGPGIPHKVQLKELISDIRNNKVQFYDSPKFKMGVADIFGIRPGLLVVPTNKLGNAQRLFTDTEYLTAEYEKTIKNISRAFADSVIAESGIFKEVKLESSKVGPGMIAKMHEMLPESSRAAVVDFLNSGVVTSTDDTLIMGLNAKSARSLFRGMGEGNSISDLLVQRIAGVRSDGVNSAVSLLNNGTTYTLSDSGVLADPDGFIHGIHGIHDVGTQKLSAEALLKSPVMSDPASVAIEEFHKVDSRFFSMPGHDKENMRLISTYGTPEAFKEQLRTLKEIDEGTISGIHVLDIESSPEGVYDIGLGYARKDYQSGYKLVRNEHTVDLGMAARHDEFVVRKSIPGEDNSYKGRLEKANTEERLHHGISISTTEAVGSTAEERERNMISGLADKLRKVGKDEVLSTHNRPFEFTKLAERANALGLTNDAAFFKSIDDGTSGIRYVDTMISAQMADYNLSGWGVNSAAKKMVRSQEANWKEAHVAPGDVGVQFDLLMHSAKAGRENVEHILSNEPEDIVGNLLWGVQGDKKGRLYKVEGYATSPLDDSETHLSLLLREQERGKNGLVPGKLVEETRAGHYLGKTVNGKFVGVSEAEGLGLLDDTVMDYSSRRIRNILTDVNQPDIDMARVELLRNGAPDLTRLSEAQNQEIIDRIGKEGLPETLRQRKWLAEWGEKDWRIKAQFDPIKDYLSGEYAAVHEPFYKFAKTLDLSTGQQEELLKAWDRDVTGILGERKKVAYTPPKHAYTMSVELPGMGKPQAIHIATPEQMEESISRITESYLPHMDEYELAKAVNGTATYDEMRKIMSGEAKFAELKMETQEALHSFVKNDVIFNSFKSSRTSFTSRVIDEAGEEFLTKAIEGPKQLYESLEQLGRDPASISQGAYGILSKRDFTDLSSRVTPESITQAQKESIAALQETYKSGWKSKVSWTDEARVFPEGRVPRAMWGISVPEVYDEYKKKKRDLVGTQYESIKEADEVAKRHAERDLKSIFTDPDVYSDLPGNVKDDLMSHFGFSGKAYGSEEVTAFREEATGDRIPSSVTKQLEREAGWAAEREARQHEREVIAEQRSVISSRIEQAKNAEDLAGIEHPNNLAGDLGNSSLDDLWNLSRNRNLSDAARANLAGIADTVSAGTASGLTTVLGEFVPSTIATKHVAAMNAIDSAAEYLTKGMSPKLALGVEALGAGAALFLAKRPNLQPEEERLTPSQRFERTVNRNEKPLYFRIMANVRGEVDDTTGATEDQLIAGAKQAVAMHMQGTTLKQMSQDSTDSRKPFGKMYVDSLGARLTSRLGGPIDRG